MSDYKYPCKIGTIPMVIFAVDKRTPFEVGRMVRVKRMRGSPWETVVIDRVDADGYFKAHWL